MEKTPVLFRRFKDGDVIAIFPTDLGNCDPLTCSSYMHVGQHGACDPQRLIYATKAAAPEEYADLRVELEGLGYELKIYRRLQRSFFLERKRQLKASGG